MSERNGERRNRPKLAIIGYTYSFNFFKLERFEGKTIIKIIAKAKGVMRNFNWLILSGLYRPTR